MCKCLNQLQHGLALPLTADEKVKITKDKTKKYSITKLHKIPV